MGLQHSKSYVRYLPENNPKSYNVLRLCHENSVSGGLSFHCGAFTLGLFSLWGFYFGLVSA